MTGPTLPARGTRARWIVAMLLMLGAGAFAYTRWDRERVTDPSFDTLVAEPAYPTAGPRVLYDEGHHNAHTHGGRYKGFVELITHDGYDVQVNGAPFAEDLLRDVAVLVIAGARGRNDAEDAGAFTDAEIAAVEAWVRGGGSLLLVVDHYPFGAAAADLARRLGVDVSNGLVEDPVHHDPARGASHLVFGRDNGLLLDHPITRGRSEAERLQQVLTFTGTSLGGTDRGSVLLALSDSAVDRPAGVPVVDSSGGDVRVSLVYGDPRPAAGRSQGIAVTIGAGRVVVLGETGMLSAQRNGPNGSRVGMNVPGYDNRQLALNLMHWLSRLL